MKIVIHLKEIASIMTISVKGTLVVILLIFFCTCFARDYNDVPGGGDVDNSFLSEHGIDMDHGFMNNRPNTDDHIRIMSSMMIHYIISKGCDYISASVKHHFSKVDHSHTHEYNHKTCDWKPWMEKKCGLYHVPMELCCALMDCGASRSLDALRAPHGMIEQCNMTDAARKRDNHIHTDQPSTSRMCSHIQALIFGKRDDHTEHVTQLSQQLQLNNHNISDKLSAFNFRNVSVKPESSVSGGQSKLIRRWCKVFSRNVSKKFHLKESRFVRRSVYWLVDIYKVAVGHHMPNYYTHRFI